MAGFVMLIGLSLLFLIFLITESILYNRKIRQVPLRITVSGTRGKTSIARSLAAVLRADGRRILAKTTGSEAMYILPDGSLEKIRRKGLTTILEQKRLMAKAVDLGVECVITEIMSIHPDNHRVETMKLIRPGITVLSNFRADHTDVAGESIREISELFAHDIYPGSVVIIPESGVNEFIIKEIDQKDARLLTAGTGICRDLNLEEPLLQKHIQTNLDIVVAVARHLGIPDETIRKGIPETRRDIGQPEIFRLHDKNRKIWFVNAFAANDPVSTRQIMVKIREILSPEITAEPEIIGLLALRSDRGERSHQWLDYLNAEGEQLFHRVYVSGVHSPIFARKLKNCEKLISKKPDAITSQIIDSTQRDILVFGIANIHGLGKDLINFWRQPTTDNR